MDKTTHAILAIVIMAAITLLLRVFPFLVFGKRETPPLYPLSRKISALCHYGYARGVLPQGGLGDFVSVRYSRADRHRRGCPASYMEKKHAPLYCLRRYFLYAPRPIGFLTCKKKTIIYIYTKKEINYDQRMEWISRRAIYV